MTKYVCIHCEKIWEGSDPDDHILKNENLTCPECGSHEVRWNGGIALEDKDHCLKKDSIDLASKLCQIVSEHINESTDGGKNPLNITVIMNAAGMLNGWIKSNIEQDVNNKEDQ